MVIAAIGLMLLMHRGFSVRKSRGRVETSVAIGLRNVSIPADMRRLRNPLATDPEAWRDGAEHFEEHCAFCHGPEGRGRNYVGQHLDPPAPDLSQPRTQHLSDGALYAIIMNGVRWTGMPAWVDDHTPEETWKLVAYIRKLPALPARREAASEPMQHEHR